MNGKILIPVLKILGFGKGSVVTGGLPTLYLNTRTNRIERCHGKGNYGGVK